MYVYTTGEGVGGGGALGYRMDTHCQTVAQCESSERHNLRAVRFFFGAENGGSQLQTKNTIGASNNKEAV